ncbi:phage terminase small subunit P27 family [Azohydromonas aeria]|uniref:phage terminase small subunit P27 family n=1 Tax=Azohydromonas aeria TaxID=2590212 RepID=UPI0012F9BDDE|nr:phage terminase small subunit P27 family [Azohydromonas aeria]
MPGPPPKPSHLKIISGNPGKKPLNKREPKPRREIPSCPAHLPDEAKVAWGRMSVLLDRMGVLTEADAYALERGCAVYAEILTYQKLVDESGATYTTTSTQGDTVIKANPAVAMLADADRRFKAWLVEFGLTPAARSKVHVQNPDDAEKKDPLSEFFG